MSLEIRYLDEEGRERRVSPARDVAYFWPRIVQLAAEGLLGDNLEPWLSDYLAYHKLKKSQLLDALIAYWRFCELSVAVDLQDPRSALEASGFFACHPAAQLAVCAKLGQLTSGAFWAGIRSSTPQGDTPDVLRELRHAALDLVKGPDGHLSRWRRQLRLWWRKLTCRT